MSWDWKKFKHQNTYNDDCLIVTAVNAYYFLTGETIHIDEKYYLYLCELNRGHDFQNIEKVHEELGLETFDASFDKTKFDILNGEFNAPIEMIIANGLHSVLIVGRNKICHTLLVTNFGNNYARKGPNYGWIWEEDLNLVITKYYIGIKKYDDL